MGLDLSPKTRYAYPQPNADNFIVIVCSAIPVQPLALGSMHLAGTVVAQFSDPTPDAQ